jgi:hypothetical protein
MSDAARPEESFTLADAEGGFIEVTGAEALRSKFERVFFDKHLSPDQILRLWESNEKARAAIEQLFGIETLNAVAERLELRKPCASNPPAITQRRASRSKPKRNRRARLPRAPRPRAAGDAADAGKRQLSMLTCS